MAYKYHVFDDYSEGAHPQILEALTRTNLQQEQGYSDDTFSTQARKIIQQKCNQPQAAVHFVATGTQANIVCLSSMLKPFESVIAVSSAHINVYEAGAIEATGHKVHALPAQDGKLTQELFQKRLDDHNFDQIVKPKVIYNSQTTELGSVYSKKELEALAEIRDKNSLYLYIDGARLGHAITAHDSDTDLTDIARLADMFYIGGTKNGGLMGEAIVIPNQSLQTQFTYHLRQRGALLAKARSVSLQFIEFFKDDLYFKSAKYANEMAQHLAAGIKSCGYDFVSPPVTNQLFVILPNEVLEKLKQIYGFHIWGRSHLKDHTIVRFLTSWATPKAAIEEFITDFSRF